MQIKIGLKIVLAVVVFSALIIGLTSIFAFNFYQSSIIDQMELTGQQFARTIKTSLNHNMMNNQYDSVRHTIAAIGKQEGIAKVRLFTVQGQIFYSSKIKEVGKSYPMDSLECMVCHVNDKLEAPKLEQRTKIFEAEDGITYLGIFDPINNEKGCYTADCHYHSSESKILGVLDVVIPLESMQERIKTGSIRTAAFAILAIIILSFVTLLVVRILVLLPIRKLVAATGRVAKGEWTDPISGGRQDEMGDLIRSFNRMQETLKVSQRQLVLSGKLASVGKLAAGVAHEINNPLTGILTFAEDLLDESEEDDPKREDYLVIKRESIRCRQIVRNLLDFARQDKPQISSVDVNEVLKRTITLIERLAQFQNCVIETSLQPNLPLVRGDAGQLQQIYLNLLINSAEAMPEGGKITIKSIHGRRNPLITTTVTDTGIGMSEEEKRRIFEPFYSTKKGKTQGLGLAVTWGILEQHGGSIDVESEVDKGTKFTVRLPAYRTKIRKK